MSRKILVADDSVVIQKSIGITFAQEDFQVTFVGNGEEAFQRATELKPDLILADTTMPKLSGAELCKKFRQEADFRRTPILLLANAQETFSPAQLKTMGANDFIQKPFESNALLEKVKTIFSQPADVSAAQGASMEQSLENTFSQKTKSEEDTAVTFAPTPAPAELEKSEDFLPDTISLQEPYSPSPNTLASLDVLSLDDDDKSDEFVPYEEENTKTVSASSVYKAPEVSAPAPTPAPKSAEATQVEPIATTPAQSLQLTEAQIEQIVSKVFQNVIERIAWEVVPEMAERIIKEEIAKITDDK